jgi:hypothetical protein
MDEQLKFLLIIAERLDGAGISYMVTGSLALAVYATPRMTRDIDVVVEIDAGDVETVVGLFQPDCFVEEETVRRAVETQGMFNIIHTDWIIKADFVVKKSEAYRLTEFERRRIIEIDGNPVVFVAPEDLILSKLCWSRESASELQERDVSDLLRAVEDLDLEYLSRRASELDARDRLDRLSER